MLTSNGDVLRVPLYFHIYTDLVKFMPSIIDFGIIPYRFDPLTIPVAVSIRNGFDIGNSISLTDILLPMNDKRLDFSIRKWVKEPTSIFMIHNKVSGKLEEHKHTLI